MASVHDFSGKCNFKCLSRIRHVCLVDVHVFINQCLILVVTISMHENLKNKLAWVWPACAVLWWRWRTKSPKPHRPWYLSFGQICLPNNLYTYICIAILKQNRYKLFRMYLSVAFFFYLYFHFFCFQIRWVCIESKTPATRIQLYRYMGTARLLTPVTCLINEQARKQQLKLASGANLEREFLLYVIEFWKHLNLFSCLHQILICLSFE